MATDVFDVERERQLANRRHRWGRFTLYSLAIGAAVLAAFPFLFATLTAFKQNSDLYVKDNNPFWFNDAPTFEHVRFLLFETNFLTFVRNTVVARLA